MAWVTMDGPDLLLRFRERRCEEAFSGLVKRYANLVYSVAKRRLGDAQQAEDATQNVFLRLAQAAPELHTESEVLGWLHRTTVHVSIDAWRSRSRRQLREESAAMSLPPNDPSAASAWNQIQPDLDEAITELGDTDREAILQRFFQEKPMREIGAALRISEAAAKMRVSRAVGNLRRLLVQRGITSVSAVVLATMLQEHSLEAAPAACLSRLAATQLPVARQEIPQSSSFEPSSPPPALLSRLASWLLRHPWVSTTAALLLVSTVLVFDLGRRSPTPTDVAVAPASMAPDEARTVRPLRLAAKVPSSEALGTPAATSGNPDAAALVDLEDLEQELRSLLHEPSPATHYPPPALASVLARFGNQLGRAVPILVEALKASDYETRAWASAGLSRTFQMLRSDPRLNGSLEAAYAAAAPALSALLRNPGEPGLLRMNAIDAVPALLEFATATEGWGDGGYARSAREAACRIDPAQRARFPEIDGRLKQEEGVVVSSTSAETPALTPGQLVLQTYRTRGQSPIFLHQTGPEFDAIRRSMITSLENEMERAPVESRAEILQAMEWARGLQKAGELENPPPPPPRFADLALTARVLAIDEANLPSPTIDEVRFSQFLERFEKQPDGPASAAVVTAENFAAFSRALREFDAGFEEKWRQALRRDLPGLDRTVPALRR